MNGPQGGLDNQILSKLENIVGRANMITQREQMANYAVDEMPDAKPMFPQVVVKPVDASSVARIMKLAYENNIPVTPRGAGTGLNAGAVAIHGGIMLSLEHMNKVMEIDREN